MSRLIDADELLKKATKDGAYDYVSAKEIADQPTAYDVEAVVRELGKYEQLYFLNDGTYTIAIPSYLAEDIVKRGGRDDCV